MAGSGLGSRPDAIIPIIVELDDRPSVIVRRLLDGQLLAVLGTHHAGAPYTSLVAFAATEDLRSLLFATSRATRKWANLTDDARASMLIDSRTNRAETSRTRPR